MYGRVNGEFLNQWLEIMSKKAQTNTNGHASDCTEVQMLGVGFSVVPNILSLSYYKKTSICLESEMQQSFSIIWPQQVFYVLSTVQNLLYNSQEKQRALHTNRRIMPIVTEAIFMKTIIFSGLNANMTPFYFVFLHK